MEGHRIIMWCKWERERGGGMSYYYTLVGNMNYNGLPTELK